MPSEALGKLSTLLVDQPHVPLRPNQLREYQEERARLTAMIDGRDSEGNPVPWIGGNRAEAQKRRRTIDKTLSEQAPKPLGPKASEVYRLATEVIQKEIRPSMLSHAVMNRCPAGAPGEYMRREGSPQIKRTILTVRRALRALDPHNDDPDLCNMDRFRPTGEGPSGAATFDVSATIPGNFAMSPLAKENWPLGEPQVDTPLKQAQRQETAPRPKPKPKGRTYSISAEERQIRADRAKAMWAAKRTQQKPVTPEESSNATE